MSPRAHDVRIQIKDEKDRRIEIAEERADRAEAAAAAAEAGKASAEAGKASAEAEAAALQVTMLLRFLMLCPVILSCKSKFLNTFCSIPIANVN